METTDVLIVGAGPSGLATANLVARYGARVHVIDESPGLIQHSRANLVHVRTLELWDKLNLAAPAVERGQPILGTRLWAGGKILLDLPFSGRQLMTTPYPFGLVYEQFKTQGMLADSLMATAGANARIEWGSRLIGVDQDANGVKARVVCADGTEKTIGAAWGVGADGVRSTVRDLLGVPFEGSSFGQIGFLADVDIDFSGMTPPRPDRVNMFLAPIGSVGFVKFHGTERSQYRLFGTVTPGLLTAIEAQLDEGIGVSHLQRWFDEQFRLQARINRCDWYHSYRLHRKIAARFRIGRWFLVGDAAHAHPPSGGQGANQSMGDGFNLGWKLGAVVVGQADQALLDSYQAERRLSSQAIMSGSSKGFMLEAAGSPVWRRVRQVLLPLGLRVANWIPALRDLGVKLMSQQWIKYPDSPAVAGVATKGDVPGPGYRAPDAMLAGGEGRLFTLLRGVDHHLLVLHHDPHSPQPRSANDLIHLSAGFRVAIQIHVLGREHVEVHRAYRVDEPTVVLVRPDGHIAYRGVLADLTGLRNYLNRWYVRTALPIAAQQGLPRPQGVATGGHR